MSSFLSYLAACSALAWCLFGGSILHLDHFYQFDTSSGFVNSRCSLMQLTWFARPWVIWKERYERLFPGQENSPAQLLKNVKLLSFWWFKAKFVIFPYNFHN